MDNLYSVDAEALKAMLAHISKKRDIYQDELESGWLKIADKYEGLPSEEIERAVTVYLNSSDSAHVAGAIAVFDTLIKELKSLIDNPRVPLDESSPEAKSFIDSFLNDIFLRNVDEKGYNTKEDESDENEGE